MLQLQLQTTRKCVGIYLGHILSKTTAFLEATAVTAKATMIP